ncbi:LPXTG cell wall anchor domain-containing protein [Paenimyroides tangerinum]|uniref:LPXTG cell wall anchor domain-containing protein n=1 Tax=Paenimyroides tangerinum TaxID=2488728 RepID=A0A3P3W2I4_9FLAO|nr:LPXTG cell wall anchor domain-containing protein [Paenimyroides tangerinum]RRJ89311.1 LPXTG cell wall anchor domain-containing protein [Paenimyroides tangerinum]
MKKVVLFLGLISFSMQAQTKMIAFKSHSGNAADFSNSVFKDIFDVNDANFGVAPERRVINSKLDTVIFIDEHKSVIVTSEFCREFHTNDTTDWKPGKDTLIDNPVFIISNLDSIKSNLKKDYYFRNNIDSVVFLKYDAKKKTYKNITPKKEKLKTKKTKENRNSNATIFGFLLISGAVGFFGIRKKK